MSHHQVVRDATEAGLVRMVVMMAAITPLAALIQVLANARDYRQPAVAVAVWLAVFAAAARLVPRVRTSGLTAGEAAAALGIAVAAVAAIGWAHRAHYGPGRPDLAILGVSWLLVLVTLSRPPRVWIPGALVVLAVHAVMLFRAVGVNRLSVAQFQTGGYILAVSLTAFAVLRPTLATLTAMTARRAALASRSEAERAAAAAVLAERRSRLALLEMEALPLLRGIADGILDPAAGGVREQCARHAAVLRHSLTGRAPGAGGLMATLEPSLQAASARGLLVDVQVIGDPGSPPPGVARAVDAVLGALPPHQVTLTTLAPGDDVELYLTFSEPLRTVPDLAQAARWHATVNAGCLEIGWRKGGAG